MTNGELEFLLAKMKKFSVQSCQNLAFSQLTTLGVGGTIKLTVYPDTPRKFKLSVSLLEKLRVKYYIVGKGSNILASDDDFDGVVISTVKLSAIKIRGASVKAYAGVSTAKLALELKRKGLSGGEFFACLPASVGGAVVCNAGCYGQNVEETVKKVAVLYKGKIKILSAKKCGFSKRNSIFKRTGKYAVLYAVFKFVKSTPQAVYNAITDMKCKKAQSQPLNYRSAGCVLYHDRVAVSKLLDESGLKGLTIGGAQVSLKHAGFVVNTGDATSCDVYSLIRRMRETLTANYGISAKTEVCLVNFSKE